MKKISVFAGIIFLLIACRGNKNKYEFSSSLEKDFYTDCEGMDYVRFPMIMPYEAMCIDLQEMNWIINLHAGKDFYYSIDQVGKVFATDNVILIYSRNSNPVISDEEAKQWFVVIPSKKVEVGFAKELEFNDYIKQYGITEIKWIGANEAFQQFKDTECLPWIAGCSK